MIVKNNNGYFVRIPQTALHDRRLKIVDIGILAHLLDNSANWVVRQREIARRVGVTTNTVRASFKRLTEAGYLSQYHRSRNCGKYAGGDWIVYDTPRAAGGTNPAPFAAEAAEDNRDGLFI